MPSPIGHAIAGLAIGFACDPEIPQAPQARNSSPWPWRFVFLAALFAILPDFDLALPKGTHRSFTHSFIAGSDGGVAGWCTRLNCIVGGIVAAPRARR